MMVTLNDIPGITRKEVELLREAGVRTIGQLLEQASTPSGRLRLADHAQLDEMQLKQWVHCADLMRIQGLRPEVAALLYQAGVLTVPKLAFCASDSLFAELYDLSQSQKITHHLPTRPELGAWIAAAKRLPKLVRH